MQDYHHISKEVTAVNSDINEALASMRRLSFTALKLEEKGKSTEEVDNQIIELGRSILSANITLQDTAATRYMLGDALLRQGFIEKGQEEVQAALKAYPRLDNALLCFSAWKALSQIELERGHSNKAIENLENAISTIKTYYSSEEGAGALGCAYRALSDLYINLQDDADNEFEKALYYARKSMSVTPDSPLNYYQLAGVYWMREANTHSSRDKKRAIENATMYLDMIGSPSESEKEQVELMMKIIHSVTD